MTRYPIRRAITIGGGAALAAVLLMSAVTAAEPSSGLISGCVTKAGLLRVLKDGATCPKAETPISWNQQGLPGTDGIDGTNGTDGAAGAPGPAGPSKVYATAPRTNGALALQVWTPIATLNLPAGDYLLHGVVQANHAGGAEATQVPLICAAGTPGNEWDSWGSGGGIAQVPSLGATTISFNRTISSAEAFTVELSCIVNALPGSSTARWQYPTLTASLAEIIQQ
jgi:hypothetical protein